MDDSYVVTDGEILGGGLSVSFQNIESLMVAAQEGNGKSIHTKYSMGILFHCFLTCLVHLLVACHSFFTTDLVTILSTGPAMVTTILGNLGSDTFVITPREVDPGKIWAPKDVSCTST